MGIQERNLGIFFRIDSDPRAEEGIPYGFEEGARFDVEAFKAANPHVAKLIYEGPYEHLATVGTSRPTHGLIILFDNDDGSHGITINDFRGRTGESIVEFNWHGAIDDEKSRLELSIDPDSSRKFRVTRADVSLEDHPEKILGTDAGLSISAAYAPGPVQLIRSATYTVKTARILRSFMEDFRGLDFSTSPLPRVQNLTQSELKEKGIVIPQKR